ncbi:MAG: DUF1573 domain-containing protein [Muribaculaceae bacterium]|nr:DUF1573 domain-containing protein [Muribaculaceae bacterium]
MTRITTIAASLLCVIAASATPRLTWLEDAHDFGAFNEDLGTVSCRIPFVNTGNSPLVITAARATCGCTTPTYPKDPIAPGDTAFVTVRYNAIGRPGRFNKKVYVFANTTPERHSITIRGVVIGASNTLKSRFPVDAGPMKLRSATVPFGQLYRGKCKTVFLDAYNQSADTIRPIWRSLPQGITVECSPSAIPPGEQAAFSFFLDSSQLPEWGINTGVAVVSPSDSSSISTEISTIAIVEEDFSRLTPGQRKNAPSLSVSPAKADLAMIDRDSDPVKAVFEITNTGKDPLIIRRIQSSDPAVTATDISTMTVKHGKKAILTLTIDPSHAEADIINSRISIITNDPDNSTVTVRAVGEIQ